MAGEYSPPNTFYSHVKGLDTNEDMFKFIGKQGSHFKFLTNKLGLDYIWWNKDSNVIELWGHHNRMLNAQKVMKQKKEKYLENELIKKFDKNFPELGSIADMV